MSKTYYVYEWFFDDTGKPFYVGKGSGRRYREKKDRSTVFRNYISKFKCSSRKIIEGLHESEAYDKEVEVIKKYRDEGHKLINKTDGGDAPPKLKGLLSRNRREVVQLTIKGHFVKKWDVIYDAEEKLGISNTTIVKSCKSGGRKSAGGFLWVYSEEYNENHDYVYKPKTVARPILQYRLDGTFVREWGSLRQASEELGITESPLCASLNGRSYSSAGYMWRYKESDEAPERIQGALETRGKTRTSGMPTPVIQLGFDGGFIARYKNCTEAKNAMGVRDNTNILRSCNNKDATAYGFKWVYEYEYEYLKSAQL